MRLRFCLMLVAAAGAVGSLVLAADMYRRLSTAERLAMEGLSASGGNAGMVFSTAHMLGIAGLSVMFLSICLMLIAEKRSALDENAFHLDEVAVTDIASIEAFPLADYARQRADANLTAATAAAAAPFAVPSPAEQIGARPVSNRFSCRTESAVSIRAKYLHSSSSTKHRPSVRAPRRRSRHADPDHRNGIPARGRV